MDGTLPAARQSSKSKTGENLVRGLHGPSGAGVRGAVRDFMRAEFNLLVTPTGGEADNGCVIGKSDTA